MDFSNDQQISSDGNFENFSEEVQKEEASGNGQAEGDSNAIAGDPNKSTSVDDDAADDARKIFVGGIHHEATEKELIDYFNAFGKVRKCIIKVDKFTGHSRGFGFIVFEEEESVQKTLDHPEHKLRNKKIEPKRAKPSREPQKKIFVGGIEPDVTEEQIKEYFGQFGKIESLDLPFDSHRQKRKAYIFVGYSTEAEARKACEKEKQDIYGKRCDVRIAVQKEQLQKQKGPWGNWHHQGGYGNYSGYGYPGYDQNYSYPGYNDYGSSYNYGAPAAGYGAPNYGSTTGSYDYNSYSGYGGYDYGYNYGHGGYGSSGGGSTRGGYGGGGKMGRGRGSSSGTNSTTSGTGGGFHPYNR